MRYRLIHNGLICLTLITGMAAIPSHSQQGNMADATQPAKVPALKPEFAQACREALQRIAREALKGADAKFSSSDNSALEVCESAVNAAKVSAAVGAPSPDLKSRIRPEWIKKAQESSGRILAEFNGGGTAALFHSDDSKRVKSFAIVLVALQFLRLADSPKVMKGIEPELIESSKKAAHAILAAFNRDGLVTVRFTDMMNLQELASKLPENKK